jgi:hypothetical protein
MFVYVHIPKTGGTTFSGILENTFGISHCHAFHVRKNIFDKNDFAFARMVFPRMRSLSGSNLINPLELGIPGPFFATFMREPVARVLSHYQHIARYGRPMPFEEELRSNESMQNLTVKILAGGLNLGRAKVFLEKCGFIGFTDIFDFSLRILDKLSPYKLNLNYHPGQVAPNNSIKKKLEADPRAMEMTREFNRLDLELYTFARNEIFPRFCVKAGINPPETVESPAVSTGGLTFRYRLSGFYNKRIFRELCRIRSFIRHEAPDPSAARSLSR